ncbi:MAG: sulfite exporter TauE/SafE family protein, partial [Planktomarina sp.]
AATQLAKIRLRFLATKPGLYGAGLIAGIASGLAHVGGMVVALYVLARKDAAGRMRATLVMYLSISVCLSVVTHLVIGTLDLQTFWRGLFFAIPSTIGVIAGQFLFIPAWEKYYKPFCLLLLIALAVAGVLRLVLA